MCIIPGTAAVAGITRVDEPVGDLLDRFEQAAIDEAMAALEAPRTAAVMSRRHGRTDVTRSARRRAGRARRAVGRAASPPTRCTASRRRRTGRFTASPVTRSQCHQPVHGRRLEVVGEHVVLSVPLSDIWIDIRFTLRQAPSTAAAGGHRPRTPRRDAFGARDRRRRRRARGAPTVHDVDGDKTATVTVEWDPERVADHTGVTATFGDTLWPTLTVIPDAVVGLCWPAVFAAIGRPSPRPASRWSRVC